MKVYLFAPKVKPGPPAMLKVLEVCLVVSLAALLSVGMSWSAEGADKGCDEERQFSGRDYWL
jgi:hypothetical protein